MKNDIVNDIWPPIPYLAKFSFLSYGPKCCQPIKLQDSLKCNISRKKWMMKFIFGMQINIEVFYKLILSFWVCVYPVNAGEFTICLQIYRQPATFFKKKLWNSYFYANFHNFLDAAFLQNLQAIDYYFLLKKTNHC